MDANEPFWKYFTRATVTGWLKKTKEGRNLLQSIVAWALRRRLAQERRVLIVLRRLGNYPGAEVYCEPGATVKFLELPDVPDDAELGKYVEALIKAKLPKKWREIVELPSARIHAEVFRGISAEEALVHAKTLELLEELKTI